MATSNEDIRDALIRRQTRTIKAGVSIGREMQRLLGKVDGDLRRLIEQGVDPVTGRRVKFGKTRTARLQAIQKAIRELQRPTYKEIRAALKESVVEIGTLEAAFAAETVTAALPVTVNLALPSSALLRTIATSKPFQGKLLSRWVSELETRDATRMMDQIRIGMVEGEGTEQIARRVFGTAQQGFNNGTRALTKRDIEGITRTAVNFMTNQGRQEMYLANKALIPEELYVATLDNRTTILCQGLDGKRFKVGEGPTPPVHFRCRSLRVPVINGKVAGTRPAKGVIKSDLEGLSKKEQRDTIARLTGNVPASETYTKFLRKQPVAFQNEVLGKTRATLFRKGGIPLDAFTDAQGKQFTLKALRGDHPEAFIRAGLQNE